MSSDTFGSQISRKSDVFFASRYFGIDLDPVSSELSQMEYQLRFPTYGFYKFHVFAAAASDTAEGIPGVFNYLIEANF